MKKVNGENVQPYLKLKTQTRFCSTSSILSMRDRSPTLQNKLDSQLIILPKYSLAKIPYQPIHLTIKNGGSKSHLCSTVKLTWTACTINILWLSMTPLKSSVSDTTIWSFTLESSIMIVEESFTLTYDVHGTGTTYNDHQLTLFICF